MKQLNLILCFLIVSHSMLYSQKVRTDQLKTTNGTIHIQPVLHGSLVLKYNGTTIYVDPYGGHKMYRNIDAPDIILITDIHGDHLHQKTLDSIDTSKADFIVPKAVAEKLPEKYQSKVSLLNNEQGIHRLGIFIRAIPMYNLPEEENSMHPKGRGNGYLLSIENKQIYISGDTEDIPEMRILQDIDIAFICMNLPYTMDINQAASAVLEFKPKVVYPYHFRGQGGFSDIKAFKELVQSKNETIEVRIRNWYPE